jgi:hypothetical protein
LQARDRCRGQIQIPSRSRTFSITAACDALMELLAWVADSEKVTNNRKQVAGEDAVTIAVEETRIRNLFERVETVEDVAMTLAENDERRIRLLAVSESALAEEATIRPVIAAKLLGLSEKTVRAWAAAGVLAIARPSPRLLLDVQSVHAVSHLLRELRAVGHDRDLLDQIWHRLSDSALVNRADLRESVAQMKRGEGRVLRPLRNPAGPDSR